MCGRLAHALAVAFACGFVAACTYEDTVAYLGTPCASDTDCGEGTRCGDGRCSEPAPACGRASVAPLTPELCAAGAALDYGLCAADGFVSQQGLDIDGGGSFGTNGPVNVSERLRVSGSVVVDAADGIVTAGTGDLDVGGGLRVSGPVLGAVAVHVGGDAEIAGNVDVRDLTVGGTLTTAPGSTVLTSGERSVGGLATAAIDVAPPCNPGTDLAGAIGAAVRARRTDNDDALAGLDPFALDGFDGGETLRLVCGRYHLSRIAGSGPLELEIEGTVALFVDAEIALDGAFTVNVAKGARLALFVEGDIRVTGEVSLGDPAQPGSLAVYGGGGGTVSLAAEANIAGSLVAPRAELVTAAPLTLWGGGIAVRRAAPGGSLTVHYDRAASALPGCP